MPAAYALLARRTGSPLAVERRLAKEEVAHPAGRPPGACGVRPFVLFLAHVQPDTPSGHAPREEQQAQHPSLRNASWLRAVERPIAPSRTGTASAGAMMAKSFSVSALMIDPWSM